MVARLSVIAYVMQDCAVQRALEVAGPVTEGGLLLICSQSAHRVGNPSDWQIHKPFHELRRRAWPSVLVHIHQIHGLQEVKQCHQKRDSSMALPPEKIAQLQAAQKTAQDREVNQAKELINAQDIGYTSKLFVQALFPYRKTDEEKRVIETAQGRIVVYADGGLPYGKYPRLIMAYIVTRAVENAGKLKAGKIDLEQAVRIPLGHSMNHFLQAIGVTAVSYTHLTLPTIYSV